MPSLACHNDIGSNPTLDRLRQFSRRSALGHAWVHTPCPNPYVCPRSGLQWAWLDMDCDNFPVDHAWVDMPPNYVCRRSCHQWAWVNMPSPPRLSYVRSYLSLCRYVIVCSMSGLNWAWVDMSSSAWLDMATTKGIYTTTGRTIDRRRKEDWPPTRTVACFICFYIQYDLINCHIWGR